MAVRARESGDAIDDRARSGVAGARPGVAVALIEAGADPNSHDDDGNTALIVAANKNWTAVVRALLAKGADPNAAVFTACLSRSRPRSVHFSRAASC